MMALIWSSTTSRITLNANLDDRLGTLGVSGKVTRYLQCYSFWRWTHFKKMLDMATEHGLLTLIGADPIKM
jgi:hypothetical protein